MTYEYQERSPQDWQNNQDGYSSFETFIVDDFKKKQFKPHLERNDIRILPPASSWRPLGHFGVLISRHTNIGPNRGSYLCHNQNERLDAFVRGREPGKCAPCRGNAIARETKNEALSAALYPRSGYLVWVIDRANMAAGPLWWIMPVKQMNKEIVLRAFNPKTNKAIPVDHPYQGHDISFTYTKQGDYGTYSGVQIEPEVTPIVADPAKVQKYLDFIEKYPLPALLKYHSAAHIAQEMGGESPTQPAAAKTVNGDEEYPSGQDEWGSAPSPAVKQAAAAAPHQANGPASTTVKPVSAPTKADVDGALAQLENW